MRPPRRQSREAIPAHLRQQPSDSSFSESDDLEHHVLTGYVHVGTDPCFTPAVGPPTEQCNRGFKMDLGNPTGPLGADAICLDIVNTIYTR